ncbi:TIR domain-containing protein [Tardiphaga sp. OK245]|jgi:hypothetical protein|uniref:TIR domain-containing protein n=1 Tax=Tardiphaga sp. OK245 TaxID=1855306 RepID=UPI0008A8136D|nr:TIR domain-containing protein [Tardiphaga sp. OK245]SEI13490.1 Predicted nucleotide-binding protein containing TIR-like domain-containing protein [Tardiphaga sp. OK245]
MSENVFIAWGKNEGLAQAVAKRLQDFGYSPVVGGVQRGKSPSSFFINANVLTQMNGASAAIILAQKIFDSKGQPTNEFRPNLMFEWGYLQHRLRADAIHVFLINIEREELPGDLLNAYTQKVTLRNPANASPAAVTALANQIAAIFQKNIIEIDFDGLEIIKNYDVYRSALWEMSEGNQAFNPREAGYYVLHLLQPAFYRNDLKFIRDFMSFYDQKVSGPLSNLTILVGEILNYYDLTDNLTKLKIDRNIKKTSEYRQLNNIVDSLTSIRGSKDRIFNIFDVLLEDFIGLTNLRLFLLGKNQNHLDDAITAFQAALVECSQFKSAFQANTGFIRHLWEAYIERNLARAYFLKGKKREALQLQKSSNKKRIQIRSRLKTNGVSYLANQIELEIGLSNFDEAMQAGPTAARLTALTEEYLVPFKPRGADRVWERLHAAISSVALQRKYKDLNVQLAKLHKASRS